MKKGSGNHASKSDTFEPGSFADDLNESQQLRARLRSIVDELQKIVVMLETNLQSARLSVRPPRQAKTRSGRKKKESIMGDELENREGSDAGNNDGQVSSPRTVGK
jgi:hypothetical protein